MSVCVCAVVACSYADDVRSLELPSAMPASFAVAYDEAEKHIVERTYEAVQDLRPLAEFFDEDNPKYLDYIAYQVLTRKNIQNTRKVYRIIFMLLKETLDAEDNAFVLPCIEEHGRVLRAYQRAANAVIATKDDADRFMARPVVEDDISLASKGAAKRVLSEHFAAIAETDALRGKLKELEVRYAGMLARRAAMTAAAAECLVRVDRAEANDTIVIDGFSASVDSRRPE